MKTTPSFSTTLTLEQLGPSGTRGELHLLAMAPSEHRSDDERLKDSSKRRFIVSALLECSHLPPGDIKTDFNPDDGSSYFLVPDGYVMSRVRCPEGVFDVKKNASGEQAYVVFECDANGVAEAKELFLKGFLPFLDHQTYLANCPAVLGTIRVEDPRNLRTSIEYVSPYRHVTINPHTKAIQAELLPVYALYRDAKNSRSEFYTFLCYHKILEGLLGKMRASVRERATKKSVQLSSRRDLVPISEHISDEYKSWCGKSVKAFYDQVMTPQFRNAVAHFITDDGAVLNLSSPVELNKYSNILYVSELCVRTVIETHETWLRELDA